LDGCRKKNKRIQESEKEVTEKISAPGPMEDEV
jgi:hypothetical protein